MSEFFSFELKAYKILRDILNYPRYFAFKVSPLHVSAYKGDISAVHMLIGGGADINKEADGGTRPLHAAIQGKHEDVLKLLLEKGSKVDPLDIRGETPMFWGVSYNFGIGTLKNAGGNINAIGINRETPLHRAITFGSVESAIYLIENGAWIDALTDRGFTPLSFALLAYSKGLGSDKIVEALLEKNADVNKVYDGGSTALHLAAMFCPPQIGVALIAKGAKRDVKDNEGATPLDYAMLRMNFLSALVFLPFDGKEENKNDDNKRTCILPS